MQGISVPALSGVTIVLIVVVILLFMKPIAKIFKLAIHAVFGFALLFIINFFLGSESFHLDLNLLNCIIAGFGGIPGVLILAIFKYFIA